MLYLTKQDELTTAHHYQDFLLSLKDNLMKYQPDNALTCYSLINYLLRHGHFSFNNEMHFSPSFNYLALPSTQEPLQVMYGTACCRHINLLINDILRTLGFNVSLLYINTDETDTWHRATPATANHVAVTLKENDSEYLLDAFNNFAFQVVGHDLVLLDLPSSIPEKLLSTYPDDNVREIGQVLKKYYTLQEYGIDFVYDYSY